MSKRSVIQGIAPILLCGAMAWALSSCATAPAKAPAPPAPTAVAPAPEPTKPATPAPVADTDFQAAEAAIAEAEAAGAAQYAADLLSQAKEALAQARQKAASDPDSARALLKTSVEKANAARDAAKEAQLREQLAALDKAAEAAIADAVEAGAEQYATELLAQAKEALTQAREKGAAEAAAATVLYNQALDKAREAKAAAIEAKAKEKLANLDKDAEAAIAEAVEAGAEQYAPELLAQAKDALGQARDKVGSDRKAAEALYLDAAGKAHGARDAALAAKTKEKLAALDRDAQDAIAGAEAAEAEQYAPDLLTKARQALAQARDKTASDTGAAEVLYHTAIDTATSAKDTSLVARTQALLGKLEASLGKWKALQPDKWVPDTVDELVAKADAAKTAVEADYATGLPLATEAIATLDAAASKLGDRLKVALDLRARVQAALDETETVDASIWVPDLVQSANDAFFQGTGAWKKFRIDAAEEAWSTSLFQAQSAVAKAKGELERKRTEQLMLETMKKLEDASGKTVVDPNDNIIAPEPWDGKKELEKLKKKPLSLLIPTDGSVVVLGEKQRVTYLDEAKDQWVQGVAALNAGDLPLANEAFLQSQKLIETYLAMAVDKVYTVRLLPDRRDSLWRISEYDGIYASPWEWPKIWKRNQKLIQNPDLIYPGWQLIIPPQ